MKSFSATQNPKISTGAAICFKLADEAGLLRPMISRVKTCILRVAEDTLRERSFANSADRGKFVKQEGNVKHVIEFHFAKPTYFDDAAICNVKVYLEIQIPELNSATLGILGDAYLLANAPDLTVRQPLGQLRSKKGPYEWPVNSLSECDRVGKKIIAILVSAGIPFCDQYSTIDSIIAGVESADARLPGGKPF
ncbi:MAG: hypothetical protein K2X38_20615, partial [Gemmataceae bacterium]|nr:hypothetical protein [Gemmataceae bacterium]